MRSTSCRFCNLPGGCKYMHLDDYCRLSDHQRKSKGLPSIMHKHAKLAEHLIMTDLNAAVRMGRTTFAEVIELLCHGGRWCIEDEDSEIEVQDQARSDKVRSVVRIILQTLHYDLHDAPEIMFATYLKFEWMISRLLDCPPYVFKPMTL
ncbi:hypothetical protein DIPPA_32496 [Diplonema papillatum]|nr:hypothetical protein DIPPA_32496 [Diplonema papillatum]